MSEFNFKGFVKDLEQKYNGDKYLKTPHTTITFAMTPMMNQKTFEEIINEVALKSHFAVLGFQSKEKK